MVGYLLNVISAFALFITNNANIFNNKVNLNYNVCVNKSICLPRFKMVFSIDIDNVENIQAYNI